MTKKGSIDEASQLDSLRDACGLCSDEREFAALVRHQLRPLLPHGSLVAGIVRIAPTLLRRVHAVGVDHPPAALARLPHELDLAERPTLTRWLDTGEPQLLQLPRDAGRISARERRELDALDIRRAALHGRIDLGGIVGSCFVFCHLREPDGPTPARAMLKLTIPPLHEALMRVWRHERPVPARLPLSR